MKFKQLFLMSSMMISGASSFAMDNGDESRSESPPSYVQDTHSFLQEVENYEVTCENQPFPEDDLRYNLAYQIWGDIYLAVMNRYNR